jgi:hypothetical protein
VAWRTHECVPRRLGELLEDLADVQVACGSQAAVEASAEPVPAERVWAEFGLGT